MRSKASDYLGLLSVCHLAGAMAAFLLLAFLVFHHWVAATILEPKGTASAGSATANAGWSSVLWLVVWSTLLASLVLNTLSGFYLRKRRKRSFSIVVAAFDCLLLPFGPFLGLFSLFVLSKESVKELYAEALDDGR